MEEVCDGLLYTVWTGAPASSLQILQVQVFAS